MSVHWFYRLLDSPESVAKNNFEIDLMMLDLLEPHFVMLIPSVFYIHTLGFPLYVP